MENFVDPIKLSSKYLQNCVVVPDRYALLKYLPKDSVVAEIGVLGGDFSDFILKECRPQSLTLIDTFNINDWQSNIVKRFSSDNHFDFVNKRFKDEIDEGKVTLERGISWEMLEKFPDNHFDWIYIDADHNYSGVSNDLKVSKRVLKSSGYIVLNDYIFYSHHEKAPYGVIHAVNEFCIDNDFEIVFLALHPQMYCDVVIRKRK